MTSHPIVVSYGGGTNSTALLILIRDRGDRPTLIMFADTGDEKPGSDAGTPEPCMVCVDGYPEDLT